MSMKLYVGNLPFSTTEMEVLEMFSSAGRVVRCNLVIDRVAGRSRGFAFVEMDSPAEARNAISRFNGHELNGRPLTVNEARPREDRRKP
ncbi:MAG TPA: RNA-binding protein [Verrucomicrobiae bacterium]|nr:RNA-binding protein [Verrucomicrobiae bacterium]